MILDDLFKFPIIMVDGDAEESKRNLFSGGKSQPELDLVEGEGKYPYFALVGIADRWMPNENSYQAALQDKEFDACMVTFVNIGSFLVPWTKEKFESEFRKFVNNLKPADDTIRVVKLSKEDIKKIANDSDG